MPNAAIARALMMITAAAWLHGAHAAPVLPASAAPSGAMVAAQDAAARMTIPVMVNGQGPFPFVVDTGADRTVISRTLANLLLLPPGRDVRLHDTAGSADVRTVVLDRVAFGGRETRGVQAPVLETADLGAAGMLGIDTLHDQQVTMDFAKGTFAATTSHAEAVLDAPGTIIVLGRRRFGQLVLVDADIGGAPIMVILDTGAQNTLGNAALQRVMRAMGERKPSIVDVVSVMGSHTPADLRQISEMRLGGILLQHVPIAYADLETFRLFGLENRPAMLLGMDVLRLFRRVSVDFIRREAAFVPR